MASGFESCRVAFGIDLTRTYGLDFPQSFPYHLLGIRSDPEDGSGNRGRTTHGASRTSDNAAAEIGGNEVSGAN